MKATAQALLYNLDNKSFSEDFPGDKVLQQLT